MARLVLDRSFLHGAIDYYVHASPDPAPRRDDDLDCARELKAAGLAAAVHRHHYGSTAERSALAAKATGFELLGAIELNTCVGGLNPAAVDVAVHAGAVLVSYPTTSAANMQVPGTWAYGVERRLGLALDHGCVPVLDGDGDLRPEAREVNRLVADSGAALGLGYLDVTECLAVVEDARACGVDRVVLTNPTAISGMAVEDVRAVVAAHPGVVVEVVAYTLHPESVGGSANTDRLLALAAGEDHGAAPVDPDVPVRLAELLRRVGVDRCLLSSDGGHAGDVSPPEELLWACQVLADLGFSETELRALTAVAPARVLGR